MANTTHDLQLRAILDTSQLKQQVQQLNAQQSVNLDASGITHSINLLNQTISKFTTSLDKLSQQTEQAASKINQASNQAGGPNWGQLGKFAAGMAIRKVGKSAHDYFDAVGDDSAGSAVDFFSKVGGGALAGSAAGPWGAAVGAVLGGIEFAFDQLAENAKKAAEELALYQKTLEEARASDEAILARENTEKFNQMIATATKPQLEVERTVREAQIAAADSIKLAFRTQFGEHGITTATARIQKLKEEREGVVAKLDSISDLEEDDPGDMTVGTEVVERRAAKKRLEAIDAEIAEITKNIESYQNAEKERVQYLSELKQLNAVLAQRKAAEERAAKEAAAKAETERKAAEAEKKRIEAENKRNDDLLKKLKQADVEGAESDEISDMLKGGNLQMLHKMLTSIQAKVEWAEAEYQHYLEAGEGDKAEEARRQLMRYRGYEKSITSGITGIEEDERQTYLSDQYSDLLGQLQKQLTPAAAVANLQAMGGNMGWVDQSTENIDKNVQRIVNQLDRLAQQLRTGYGSDTGLIIY